MKTVTTAVTLKTALCVQRNGHATHLLHWTTRHESLAIGVPYNLDDFIKAYKESKKHGL
jgi:hypothetical protein